MSCALDGGGTLQVAWRLERSTTAPLNQPVWASYVVGPTGVMLSSRQWSKPPLFECANGGLRLRENGGPPVMLWLSDDGERFTVDCSTVQAELDVLWKAPPGSVRRRAESAQRAAAICFAYQPELISDNVNDLVLRERGATEGFAEQDAEARKCLWTYEFSDTPRGTTLLHEYWKGVRAAAGIGFHLQLIRKLGTADFGTSESGPPYLYWEGHSFCVAQAAAAQCRDKPQCKASCRTHGASDGKAPHHH